MRRSRTWGSLRIDMLHATAAHQHHQHPTSILTVGTEVRTDLVRLVRYVVVLHEQ